MLGDNNEQRTDDLSSVRGHIPVGGGALDPADDSGGAMEPMATPTTSPTPVPEPTLEPLPTQEPIADDPQPVGGQAQAQIIASLTFYTCSGAPVGYDDGFCPRLDSRSYDPSGLWPHDGGAACGYGLAWGTRFTIDGDPEGRSYVCNDRGAGPYYWVDRWFATYQDGRAWRNQLPVEVTIRVVQ